MEFKADLQLLQIATALRKLMHHCILAQCETLKGFRQRELNPPSLNVLWACIQASTSFLRLLAEPCWSQLCPFWWHKQKCMALPVGGVLCAGGRLRCAFLQGRNLWHQMQDTWVQIHNHFTCFTNQEVTKPTVYPTALPQYLKLQLCTLNLAVKDF